MVATRDRQRRGLRRANEATACLLQELAARAQPGVTTGEMARLLGVSVSTTSGLVIKLVDRGLLVRTTLPEDRRQEPLYLTETGEALVGELLAEGRQFLDRVAERLGDDLPLVPQGRPAVYPSAAVTQCTWTMVRGNLCCGHATGPHASAS